MVAGLASTVPEFPRQAEFLDPSPVVLGQNYFINNGTKFSRLRKKQMSSPRRRNSLAARQCERPDFSAQKCRTEQESGSEPVAEGVRAWEDPGRRSWNQNVYCDAEMPVAGRSFVSNDS